MDHKREPCIEKSTITRTKGKERPQPNNKKTFVTSRGFSFLFLAVQEKIGIPVKWIAFWPEVSGKKIRRE